jgi:rare lipoprotein A
MVGNISRALIILLCFSTLQACSTFSKGKRHGKASWYGKWHHGRTTANGEKYDMYDMTAAHKSLPFGTKLKVRSLSTGREVRVRVNDRGPYSGDRVLDLSYAAADKLGVVTKGVDDIEYSILP